MIRSQQCAQIKPDLPERQDAPGSLSYTSYRTDAITATVTGDTVRATVTVTNTGVPAGDAVVAVYVSRPVAELVAPDRRLVGFARLTLAGGQTGTVTVRIPRDRFAVTSGDVTGAGPARVQPGGYRLTAGSVGTEFTVS